MRGLGALRFLADDDFLDETAREQTSPRPVLALPSNVIALQSTDRREKLRFVAFLRPIGNLSQIARNRAVIRARFALRLLSQTSQYVTFLLPPSRYRYCSP